MLESLCRDTYEKTVVSTLLKVPAVQRCKPLAITTAACLIGVAFCPLLFFGWKWIALAALFLSGFLDTLDGAVSRYQNSSSAIGAVWDIVCDRIVEFSVLLGLYWVDPENRGLLTIGMLGSVLLCISSFLVVGIFSENQSPELKKSFHYSPGLIERAEAFLFWTVMVLVPQAFFALSCIFIALVLATTLLRLFQFGSSQSALIASAQDLDAEKGAEELGDFTDAE